MNIFNKKVILSSTVIAIVLISGFPILSHQDDDYSQQQKLLADDGAADDWFGWSVSVYNDTAAIGALGDDTDNGSDSGSVYIFEKNSTSSGTSWDQAAKITADDGAADDWFGYSVSLSSNTVLIGARYDDTDNGSDSGSAYIFEKNSTSWDQAAKITADDGAADDWFGHSVSLSSNTALIGAHGDDDNGIRSGSAYIFEYNSTSTSGSSWDQAAKITADDGAVDDYFGHSVSVYNDTALIGAYGDDANGIRSGSAYIFEYNSTSSGSWDQAAKITADDGAVGDWFGHSVSVYNDTALISAPGDDANGSAYIFEYNSTSSSWDQAAKLAADDGAFDDWFGYSVSLYDDTAVIDARYNDDNGSAYIFEYNSTSSSWDQAAKLAADDGADEDLFGYSVSVYNDTALIGAYGDDTDNGSDSGSAYIFSVVEVDTTPPVITLNGINPVILELGVGNYTELSATVTDNDPAYSGNVTVAGDTVNTNLAGNYTVTYDAPADAAGNNATQVTRTASVVDTTAPIITLNGTTPVTVKLGVDTYTELGATVTDNDSNYNGTVTTAGTVNTATAGNYIITYSAPADATGNTPSNVTRGVAVVNFITNVTSTVHDGTYTVGDKIDITVTLDESVTVNIPSIVNGTGGFDTLDDAWGVDTVTVGNSTYAIVTSRHDHGVQIINITDPALPTATASVTDGVGGFDELLGAWGVDTVTVGNSTYAIVASRYDDGVQIIDITDPASPAATASVTDGTGGFDELYTAASVDTVTVGNSTYAIVASYRDNGVQIINITNPALPTATASVTDGTGGFDELWGARDVDTVTVGNSTYAIVASLFDSGVQIINITNPALPTATASVTDSKGGFDELRAAASVDTVTVGNSTYAIVASAADDGVQIINITNPASPTATASVTDGTGGFDELRGAYGVDTVTVGNSTYAIVASRADSGVQIINITDPALPTATASVTDGTGGFDELDDARDVDTVTVGNSTYAIVASAYDDGVQIINITHLPLVFNALSPVMTLETGATDRNAIFSGLNQSDTLVFTYTVQENDTSSDLDYTSTNSVLFGNATIVSTANATVHTNLPLPAPGAENSLGYNKDIVINTTAAQ